MSQTAQTTKAKRRTRSAELRRAAKAEAARRQEERDEAIAPAVQRAAVLDASGAVLRNPNGRVIAALPDGTVLREALRNPDGSLMREAGVGVLRAARVQRDGVSFIKSSPIRHLAARWKAREDDGGRALITAKHMEICDRLCMAWQEGGEGIGAGASDYERMGQSRGSAAPDFSPQLLARIAHQRRQKAVFDGAMTWMGALSPIVRRVVVDGADLSVWATETDTPRNAASGYLAAALDRLQEFFAKLDASTDRAKQQRIRTIGPGREAYSAEVSEAAE